MAKGFKGKYFSLTAITATVNAVALHNETTRIESCHTHRRLFAGARPDEPPPDLEDFLEAIEPFTPPASRCQCHCNCFYKRRTRCILYLASLCPKRRYLYRYHITDLSPPEAFSLTN